MRKKREKNMKRKCFVNDNVNNNNTRTIGFIWKDFQLFRTNENNEHEVNEREKEREE